MAAPLHIVFLDSWHADRARGSGSAVAIAGLAGGLRSLGHRVTVLRPARRLASLDATRLGYNLGLGRRVRDARADLVVGFDFDGCLLPDLGAAPYVVALKGVMADELEYERGFERLRFSTLSRLERRNARRAARVIVTSEHSRTVAIEAYDLQPERVRVVPEGIDLEAWSDPPGNHRPRGAAPVILSVARQYRRKNTANLLRAMPLVRASFPAVLLRVIGSGPELKRLRRLAADLGLDDGGVSFAGSLPGRAAVQREMRSADIFCLPSRQEGFGSVLLEAMAAGLPIVAADAGATPEVAPHGEVALLVDPDDVEELARSLTTLLGDPGLRRRLVAGGERRWRQYSWPVIASRFLGATGCA